MSPEFDLQWDEGLPSVGLDPLARVLDEPGREPADVRYTVSRLVVLAIVVVGHGLPLRPATSREGGRGTSQGIATGGPLSADRWAARPGHGRLFAVAPRRLHVLPAADLLAPRLGEVVGDVVATRPLMDVLYGVHQLLVDAANLREAGGSPWRCRRTSTRNHLRSQFRGLTRCFQGGAAYPGTKLTMRPLIRVATSLAQRHLAVPWASTAGPSARWSWGVTPQCYQMRRSRHP